jgi:hypothetical protein
MGQNRFLKLVDANMAGRIPTSAVNTRFDFMLPPGLVGLDVFFQDFRWTTGPNNLFAGLVNNAGTSAPFVTYDNQSSSFNSLGGTLRYGIGGRINSVYGAIICGATTNGGGGNSTGTPTSSAAVSLATTAPSADRFRFYADASDRILQGQLVIFGTFR